MKRNALKYCEHLVYTAKQKNQHYIWFDIFQMLFE